MWRDIGSRTRVPSPPPAIDGYVTVYPCEQGRPEASNINYVAGQVVPNLVTVQVDPSGQVCFYTLAATDLLADLAGVFTDQRLTLAADDGYVSVDA